MELIWLQPVLAGPDLGEKFQIVFPLGFVQGVEGEPKLLVVASLGFLVQQNTQQRCHSGAFSSSSK